jgi:hypothetical protein
MIRTNGFTPMGDRYRYDFGLASSIRARTPPTTATGSIPSHLKPSASVRPTPHTSSVKQKPSSWPTSARRSRGHKERGYFIGIDGMCNPGIIAAFKVLNLEEFLH